MTKVESMICVVNNSYCRTSQQASSEKTMNVTYSRIESAKDVSSSSFHKFMTINSSLLFSCGVSFIGIVALFSIANVNGLSTSSSSLPTSNKHSNMHPSTDTMISKSTTTITTTTRLSSLQFLESDTEELSIGRPALPMMMMMTTSNNLNNDNKTTDHDRWNKMFKETIGSGTIGSGSSSMSSFDNNIDSSVRSVRLLLSSSSSMTGSKRGASVSFSNQVTALDMICKHGEVETSSAKFDKNEYEMHVGKALDTLRNDYPKILTNDPDYSIYDPNIEIVDPSGVRVRGIKTYKNSIRLLHALINLLYCPSKSGINIRMCYDQARQNIRIHWNACVVPREIFGGASVTTYVDGISVYELDQLSGNITEHRFEQILINDAPVMPKEGLIAALQRQHQHTVTIPSFIKQTRLLNNNQQQPIQQKENNIIVPFQQMNPFQGLLNQIIIKARDDNGHPMTKSSLFALEATNDDKSRTYTDDSDDPSEQHDHAMIRSNYPSLDLIAYQNKNKSRKKFGLKPLTPDEFLEIEAQVQKLASMQQEKLVLTQEEQMKKTQQEEKDVKHNRAETFFKNIFGNVLKDTCESNFDCERPEICCDFGFQKRCCFGGSLVGSTRWDQLQPIRVPVEINNNNNNNNNNYP